jgi:hypothetical protein
MKTTISNLNGQQQNALNHLSKSLRRAIQPLMIICYGHWSSTAFRSSVFLNTGMQKKNAAVFDIVIIVSDHEILPDSVLMEIAKRNSLGNPAERLIILRMADVLRNLEQNNRFFSLIFRKGIVLHASKEVLNMLPDPLPAVNSIAALEKQRLDSLLQQARVCLNKAELALGSGTGDPGLITLLLNESAVFAARYFIAVYCGIELQGEFKKILNFSANISASLTAVFPRNTPEEQLLFHVINLTFIDEGFFPGMAILSILCKRVARLLAVSKSAAQQKLAEFQIS